MIGVNQQAVHSEHADNPLVLLHRPIAPDFDPTKLSHFDDASWDLTPGILTQHSTAMRFSFDIFPPTWRLAVKTYVWNLINSESTIELRASGTPRLSLSSVRATGASLNRFLQWVKANNITDLRDIDQSRYDDFLKWLLADDSSRDTKDRTLLEVRRLWTYRNLVPPALQLPASAPWFGSTNRDLLGWQPSARENLTPRIADSTMQALVVWAARFVEDFSDDIHKGYLEYRALTDTRTRRAESPGLRRQDRVREALAELRRAGRGLPGMVGEDGALRINWRHLGRLAAVGGDRIQKFDQQLISESNLPIEEDSFLSVVCSGTIDGIQWRSRPITFIEAAGLREHLATAAFILLAYLSGMRPGEVLNLERGCLRWDQSSELWLVSGRHFKGVRNFRGESVPGGEMRAAPWVVHDLVAKSIAVLESLHSEALLFPTTLKKTVRAPEALLRNGGALTSSQIIASIASFTDWVNRYCASNRRGDGIPADARGNVSPSRFRRTLAWHIVRRPRGLVAAAIQYGHIWAKVTQGYAGTLESGFADEIAFERWLERMEQFRAAEEYLDGGGHVSGPAADEFRARTAAVQQRFAGRTVATARQAARMLDDTSVQIFQGRGLHCSFDRGLSVCAKGEDGPHLSSCDPRCQCISRTDRDIDEVRADIATLDGLQTEDQLAPPMRWSRLEAIKTDLQLIVNRHEMSKND